MKINSFDIEIQSDEFATEYEEYLQLLDSQWEEPDLVPSSSGLGQEIFIL